MTFFERLALAWRILLSATLALRVTRALETPALPAKPERAEPPPPEPEAPPRVPTELDVSSALQLLALLQREGRLVDFLQQDVSAFQDAQIGAAARVVHDGCRGALERHVKIVPVRSEAEGSRIELRAGFDAASIKLTGNVRGAAPYHGVLKHRGWRAEQVSLPRVVGDHDVRVLASAEVEL